jgi:hypothetical protein
LEVIQAPWLQEPPKDLKGWRVRRGRFTACGSRIVRQG